MLSCNFGPGSSHTAAASQPVPETAWTVLARWSCMQLLRRPRCAWGADGPPDVFPLHLLQLPVHNRHPTWLDMMRWCNLRRSHLVDLCKRASQNIFGCWDNGSSSCVPLRVAEADSRTSSQASKSPPSLFTFGQCSLAFAPQCRSCGDAPLLPCLSGRQGREPVELCGVEGRVS